MPFKIAALPIPWNRGRFTSNSLTPIRAIPIPYGSTVFWSAYTAHATT